MSVTTGQVALEAAFQWCCRRRKDSPPNADIWHLWFHWPAVSQALLTELHDNRYRLSPLQITGRGREAKAVWSAQDAVVLKWVAMQLQAVLPVHPLCEHHKGHGGGKRSVQRMHDSLQREGWQYVCRTDIQGFYGHIRRRPLMRQVKRHVQDPVLLNLVQQYLHYSVERGGEFHTPKKGICRGCALSPLLAGFCLWAMDTYFEAQPSLRYVRFMDDIVILTRTRWHLRQAVRALNVFFASGGYRQHPDKTFIGRTERGFDWMGIQFNGSGIEGVAPRALANHRERCRRLYEQVWRHGKKKTLARVSAYVKRWTIWRNSMTDSVKRDNRPGWWQARLWWLSGLLVLMGLTAFSPAYALPACGAALGHLNPTSTMTSYTPATTQPGVNPPYPLIGEAIVAGTTVNCSMAGYGETITYGTGFYNPNAVKYWPVDTNGYSYRSGAVTGPNGDVWGPDEDNYECQFGNATWAQGPACHRSKFTPLGPLICTGADGTKSDRISSGTLTATGYASVSVPCRDRPDGSGVIITVPDASVRLISNSPAGYYGGSNKRPNDVSVSGNCCAYYPGAYVVLGASATNLNGSNIPFCRPDGTNITGPCVTQQYGGQISHIDINVPPAPLGTCTASVTNNIINFGTITAGTGLSVGLPLPGVPPLTTNVSIDCSGSGAHDAAQVLVSPAGVAEWRPDIFDTNNDSIGYQLTVGDKSIRLENHKQQMLTAADGIRFVTSGNNNTAEFELTSVPVAKLPDLLVGAATAMITLDVYAVSK